MKENEYIELEEKTLEIQKQCHEMVQYLISKMESKINFNYQDPTNVFIFRKLAEYEIKIKQLESIIKP